MYKFLSRSVSKSPSSRIHFNKIHVSGTHKRSYSILKKSVSEPSIKSEVALDEQFEENSNEPNSEELPETSRHSSLADKLSYQLIKNSLFAGRPKSATPLTTFHNASGTCFFSTGVSHSKSSSGGRSFRNQDAYKQALEQCKKIQIKKKIIDHFQIAPKVHPLPLKSVEPLNEIEINTSLIESKVKFPKKKPVLTSTDLDRKVVPVIHPRQKHPFKIVYPIRPKHKIKQHTVNARAKLQVHVPNKPPQASEPPPVFQNLERSKDPPKNIDRKQSDTEQTVDGTINILNRYVVRPVTATEQKVSRLLSKKKMEPVQLTDAGSTKNIKEENKNVHSESSLKSQDELAKSSTNVLQSRLKTYAIKEVPRKSSDGPQKQILDKYDDLKLKKNIEELLQKGNNRLNKSELSANDDLNNYIKKLNNFKEQVAIKRSLNKVRSAEVEPKEDSASKNLFKHEPKAVQYPKPAHAKASFQKYPANTEKTLNAEALPCGKSQIPENKRQPVNKYQVKEASAKKSSDSKTRNEKQDAPVKVGNDDEGNLQKIVTLSSIAKNLKRQTKRDTNLSKIRSENNLENKSKPIEALEENIKNAKNSSESVVSTESLIDLVRRSSKSIQEKKVSPKISDKTETSHKDIDSKSDVSLYQKNKLGGSKTTVTGISMPKGKLTKTQAKGSDLTNDHKKISDTKTKGSDLNIPNKKLSEIKTIDLDATNASIQNKKVIETIPTTVLHSFDEPKAQVEDKNATEGHIKDKTSKDILLNKKESDLLKQNVLEEPSRMLNALPAETEKTLDTTVTKTLPALDVSVMDNTIKHTSSSAQVDELIPKNKLFTLKVNTQKKIEKSVVSSTPEEESIKRITKQPQNEQYKKDFTLKYLDGIRESMELVVKAAIFECLELNEQKIRSSGGSNSIPQGNLNTTPEGDCRQTNQPSNEEQPRECKQFVNVDEQLEAIRPNQNSSVLPKKTISPIHDDISDVDGVPELQQLNNLDTNSSSVSKKSSPTLGASANNITLDSCEFTDLNDKDTHSNTINLKGSQAEAAKVSLEERTNLSPAAEETNKFSKLEVARTQTEEDSKVNNTSANEDIIKYSDKSAAKNIKPPWPNVKSPNLQQKDSQKVQPPKIYFKKQPIREQSRGRNLKRATSKVSKQYLGKSRHKMSSNSKACLNQDDKKNKNKTFSGEKSPRKSGALQRKSSKSNLEEKGKSIPDILKLYRQLRSQNKIPNEKVEDNRKEKYVFQNDKRPKSCSRSLPNIDAGDYNAKQKKPTKVSKKELKVKTNETGNKNPTEKNKNDYKKTNSLRTDKIKKIRSEMFINTVNVSSEQNQQRTRKDDLTKDEKLGEFRNKSKKLLSQEQSTGAGTQVSNVTSETIAIENSKKRLDDTASPVQFGQSFNYKILWTQGQSKAPQEIINKFMSKDSLSEKAVSPAIGLVNHFSLIKEVTEKARKSLSSKNAASNLQRVDKLESVDSKSSGKGNDIQIVIEKTADDNIKDSVIKKESADVNNKLYLNEKPLEAQIKSFIKRKLTKEIAEIDNEVQEARILSEKTSLARKGDDSSGHLAEQPFIRKEPPPPPPPKRDERIKKTPPKPLPRASIILPPPNSREKSKLDKDEDPKNDPPQPSHLTSTIKHNERAKVLSKPDVKEILIQLKDKMLRPDVEDISNNKAVHQEKSPKLFTSLEVTKLDNVNSQTNISTKQQVPAVKLDEAKVENVKAKDIVPASSIVPTVTVDTGVKQNAIDNTIENQQKASKIELIKLNKSTPDSGLSNDMSAPKSMAAGEGGDENLRIAKLDNGLAKPTCLGAKNKLPLDSKLYAVSESNKLGNEVIKPLFLTFKSLMPPETKFETAFEPMNKESIPSKIENCESKLENQTQSKVTIESEATTVINKVNLSPNTALIPAVVSIQPDQEVSKSNKTNSIPADTSAKEIVQSKDVKAVTEEASERSDNKLLSKKVKELQKLIVFESDEKLKEKLKHIVTLIEEVNTKHTAGITRQDQNLKEENTTSSQPHTQSSIERCQVNESQVPNKSNVLLKVDSVENPKENAKLTPGVEHLISTFEFGAKKPSKRNDVKKQPLPTHIVRKLMKIKQMRDKGGKYDGTVDHANFLKVFKTSNETVIQKPNFKSNHSDSSLLKMYLLDEEPDDKRSTTVLYQKPNSKVSTSPIDKVLTCGDEKSDLGKIDPTIKRNTAFLATVDAITSRQFQDESIIRNSTEEEGAKPSLHEKCSDKQMDKTMKKTPEYSNENISVDIKDLNEKNQLNIDISGMKRKKSFLFIFNTDATDENKGDYNITANISKEKQVLKDKKTIELSRPILVPKPLNKQIIKQTSPKNKNESEAQKVESFENILGNPLAEKIVDGIDENPKQEKLSMPKVVSTPLNKRIFKKIHENASKTELSQKIEKIVEPKHQEVKSAVPVEIVNKIHEQVKANEISQPKVVPTRLNKRIFKNICDNAYMKQMFSKKRKVADPVSREVKSFEKITPVHLTAEIVGEISAAPKTDTVSMPKVVPTPLNKNILHKICENANQKKISSNKIKVEEFESLPLTTQIIIEAHSKKETLKKTCGNANKIEESLKKEPEPQESKLVEKIPSTKEIVIESRKVNEIGMLKGAPRYSQRATTCDSAKKRQTNELEDHKMKSMEKLVLIPLTMEIVNKTRKFQKLSEPKIVSTSGEEEMRKPLSSNKKEVTPIPKKIDESDSREIKSFEKCALVPLAKEISNKLSKYKTKKCNLKKKGTTPKLDNTSGQIKYLPITNPRNAENINFNTLNLEINSLLGLKEINKNIAKIDSQHRKPLISKTELLENTTLKTELQKQVHSDGVFLEDTIENEPSCDASQTQNQTTILKLEKCFNKIVKNLKRLERKNKLRKSTVSDVMMSNIKRCTNEFLSQYSDNAEESSTENEKSHTQLLPSKKETRIAQLEKVVQSKLTKIQKKKESLDKKIKEQHVSPTDMMYTIKKSIQADELLKKSSETNLRVCDSIGSLEKKPNVSDSRIDAKTTSSDISTSKKRYRATAANKLKVVSPMELMAHIRKKLKEDELLNKSSSKDILGIGKSTGTSNKNNIRVLESGILNEKKKTGSTVAQKSDESNKETLKKGIQNKPALVVSATKSLKPNELLQNSENKRAATLPHSFMEKVQPSSELLVSIKQSLEIDKLLKKSEVDDPHDDIFILDRPSFNKVLSTECSNNNEDNRPNVAATDKKKITVDCSSIEKGKNSKLDITTHAIAGSNMFDKVSATVEILAAARNKLISKPEKNKSDNALLLEPPINIATQRSEKNEDYNSLSKEKERKANNQSFKKQAGIPCEYNKTNNINNLIEKSAVTQGRSSSVSDDNQSKIELDRTKSAIVRDSILNAKRAHEINVTNLKGELLKMNNKKYIDNKTETPFMGNSAVVKDNEEYVGANVNNILLSEDDVVKIVVKTVDSLFVLDSHSPTMKVDIEKVTMADQKLQELQPLKKQDCQSTQKLATEHAKTNIWQDMMYSKVLVKPIEKNVPGNNSKKQVEIPPVTNKIQPDIQEFSPLQKFSASFKNVTSALSETSNINIGALEVQEMNVSGTSSRIKMIKASDITVEPIPLDATKRTCLYNRDVDENDYSYNKRKAAVKQRNNKNQKDMDSSGPLGDLSRRKYSTSIKELSFKDSSLNLPPTIFQIERPNIMHNDYIAIKKGMRIPQKTADNNWKVQDNETVCSKLFTLLSDKGDDKPDPPPDKKTPQKGSEAKESKKPTKKVIFRIVRSPNIFQGGRRHMKAAKSATLKTANKFAKRKEKSAKKLGKTKYHGRRNIILYILQNQMNNKLNRSNLVEDKKRLDVRESVEKMLENFKVEFTHENESDFFNVSNVDAEMEQRKRCREKVRNNFVRNIPKVLSNDTKVPILKSISNSSVVEARPNVQNNSEKLINRIISSVSKEDGSRSNILEKNSSKILNHKYLLERQVSLHQKHSDESINLRDDKIKRFTVDDGIEQFFAHVKREEKAEGNDKKSVLAKKDGSDKRGPKALWSDQSDTNDFKRILFKELSRIKYLPSIAKVDKNVDEDKPLRSYLHLESTLTESRLTKSKKFTSNTSAGIRCPNNSPSRKLMSCSRSSPNVSSPPNFIVIEKELKTAPRIENTQIERRQRYCEDVRIPTQSLAHLIDTLPDENDTTLTRKNPEKVMSVGKMPLNRRAGLKVTYLSVKKGESDDVSEQYGIKEPRKRIPDSVKDKSVAIVKLAFLKQLQEEFQNLNRITEAKLNRNSQEKENKKGTHIVDVCLEKNSNQSLFDDKEVSDFGFNLQPNNKPKNSLETILKKWIERHNNTDEKDPKVK